MLDFLRQRAGSWMVKALLAAIIIVFIFWGVGTFRTRKADVLAEVNGKPITLTEFRTLYAQRLQQLQTLFGAKLDENLLRQLQLPAQVFEDLVKRRLLAQAAKEIGVEVSTKEIQLAISQMPVFQRNGRFDPQRYRLVLRNLRLTPKDFEEMVRADLLEAKIRHLLTSPLRATENEARDWYVFENEKLKIAYIELPIAACQKEVKFNEEELKEYYEKHKERYRTPLKVALKYYILKFEDLKKELNISEEELKSYYKTHKEEFAIPEKRKIRHILITPKEGESEEALLARAQKIRQKVKGPKNFAEVARKFSDDPHTKDKGGDLGWITREELFESLREVTFAAKEGEIIGPLRTPLGYHILLVEKIKPAGQKPFEEVKDEIRKRLLEERLKHYAWEKANKIYDEIILLGGLEEWARKTKVKLEETPLFAPQEAPPAIPQEVVEAALKLEEGELGPIIETPEGLFIFKLFRREEPRIPPFEKVKERVRKDLLREKALKLCGEKAKRLLSELKTALEVTKVLDREGLSVKESTYFTRKDSFLAGVPAEVLRVARGLGRKGEWAEEPVLAGESYYLVRLVELKPPDLKEFDKEKKAYLARLTAQKRQEVFSSWYRNLREKAEVKLFQELPKI